MKLLCSTAIDHQDNLYCFDRKVTLPSIPPIGYTVVFDGELGPCEFKITGGELFDMNHDMHCLDVEPEITGGYATLLAEGMTIEELLARMEDNGWRRSDL